MGPKKNNKNEAGFQTGVLTRSQSEGLRTITPEATDDQSLSPASPENTLRLSNIFPKNLTDNQPGRQGVTGISQSNLQPSAVNITMNPSLTLSTQTKTTTSTFTTPTTTAQSSSVQAQINTFTETRPQLPNTNNQSQSTEFPASSIDTRLAEVDALCQRLIRWDTMLTEEVNYRGQKILQNEKGISELSAAIAGLQNAQRTGLEDQRLVLTRMNAQQEAFNTLAIRQQELLTGLVNNRAETLKIIDQRIASIASGNSAAPALSKTKLELPVFSGASWEPPMRFLSKFLNYLEATGASDYSFKFLVDQAFRSPATDWWEYVRNEVQNVQDFSQRFKQHFWNDNKQLIVKRELEHGHYKEQQSTRSEYVLHLYNQISLLSNPPKESVIVQCFSRHFDEQIRSSILAQGVKTISGLVAYLDSIDQAGALNRDYARTSEIHFPHSESQSAFPSPGYSKSFGQRQDYISDVSLRRDVPQHSTANSYDNRVRLKE